MPRTARSLLLVVLAAAVGAALSACGDITKPEAVFAADSASFVLRALNAGVPAAPNAVGVNGPSAVRASFEAGASNFDVAFDIDASGRPVLRPIAAVVVPCPRSSCSFGLLADTLQKFDSVKAAPTSGYKFDSTMAIRVGATYLVKAQVPACTGYYVYSDVMYAKLVVDSVRPDSTFYVRMVSDNNCGFVGLEPGKVPAR